MVGVIAWFQVNWGWMAVFIVALDNALAQIPAVEANSTFQLITGFIKKFLPSA